MFASNQILNVSGCLDSDDLEKCLEFALNYSDHSKDMEEKEFERGCRLLYQITEDGKYCIGWGVEKVPKGWSEYPFRFDIEIVGKIIKQHLKSYDIEKGIYGGSYIKGFVMTCIINKGSLEDNGIINPFYGIVFFKPYTCFFAK